MPNLLKRKIYIIDKKFQYKYVFVIISIMLLTVFSVSFTTFYVIWQNVIDEFFFVPEASKKLGDIFVKTTELLIVPTLLLAGIFGIVGVILSHKIAGPIYRAKRVAEDISKGRLDMYVKFRKGDEMHDLADSLNEMISGIKGMVVEDKTIVKKLNNLSLKLQTDVKKQKSIKGEVKDSIKELNKIVKTLKKSTERFKV